MASSLADLEAQFQRLRHDFQGSLGPSLSGSPGHRRRCCAAEQSPQPNTRHSHPIDRLGQYEPPPVFVHMDSTASPSCPSHLRSTPQPRPFPSRKRTSKPTPTKKQGWDNSFGGSGQLLPAASMDRAAWLHVNMTTPGASPSPSSERAANSANNSRPSTPDITPHSPSPNHTFRTHQYHSVSNSPTELERFAPCLSSSPSPSCGHRTRRSSPGYRRSTSHRDHSAAAGHAIDNYSSSLAQPPPFRLPSLPSYTAAAAEAVAQCPAVVERSNEDVPASPPYHPPSRLPTLPSLSAHAAPTPRAGERCPAAAGHPGFAAQPRAAMQQHASSPPCLVSHHSCSAVLATLNTPVGESCFSSAAQRESRRLHECRSSNHSLRMPSMRSGGGGAGPLEQGAARPSGSRMVEDEASPEAQMGWWREPAGVPGGHAWLQADAPPAPRDHWRFPPPPHDSVARAPLPEAMLRQPAAPGSVHMHEPSRDLNGVFDAYSQGFHFPRCEDAVGLAPLRRTPRQPAPLRDAGLGAAAQAGAGNILDGPILPDLPHGRPGVAAATAPGECCAGGGGCGRRHRRWFTGGMDDIAELHLPGLRSSLSASGALGPLRAARSGVSGERGAAWAAGGMGFPLDAEMDPATSSSSIASEEEEECEEGEEVWERRLQSVRQRLQHLRRSQRASGWEREREREDQWRPGEPQLGTPARVAVLGGLAEEQPPSGGTAARAQGRRPRGPGDAFQGMSLDQVLQSGRAREAAAVEGGNTAGRGDAMADQEGVGGGEWEVVAGRRTEAAAAQRLADAFGGLSLGQLLPPRTEAAAGRSSVEASPAREPVRHGRRRAEEAGAARRAVGGGGGDGIGRGGGSGGAFWVDVTADAGVAAEPPPLARTRNGTIVRGGRRQVLGAGARSQMGLPQRTPDVARLMRQRGRVGSPSSRDGRGGGGAEALRLLERFAFSPKAFKEMAGRIGRERQGSVSSDDYECAVCLSAFAPNQILRRYSGCGHCFHERCITAWLVRGDARCPMCRWCPIKQGW